MVGSGFGDERLASRPLPARDRLPATDMKVLLDAGHGGTKPGAIGPSGIHEKDLNAQIVKFLEMACQRHGWRTNLSRLHDQTVRNRDRAIHANQWGANVFVSVHCNAAENVMVQGHEVLHWHTSVKGALLANAISEALATQFPARPARPSKPREEGDRGATVLSRTSMPAVIVECGFISNSFEEGWLASFPAQAAIAWAISQGVERTFPEPDGDIPW